MAALITLVSSDDGRIMRLINKLAYCLAATIPVAMLAGCSGAGSSGGGGPLESSTIVIDAVPTADAAGLYIAQDEGLFAKQGLTVKIDPINGGEYGMGDLQTGKAELIEGNYVSFVLAQVAGKFAAPDPNEPDRPASAGQADRHAHHRRLVADAAGQPGAVRDARARRYKTVADDGQGPRDGRRQLAPQHRLGAARLAARRGRASASSAVNQTPEPLPLMPPTALQAQDRARPGCRSRSAPRPRRSTGRCNWPTSTRDRCRTSPSARSSAARSG